MNCKIPFTKDIELARKIYEITSISLEHEIKVQDGALNGNFIVSGDFKSHEVSVNKETFSYVLPFVIDIQDDVDPDTIEFMIDDFTYEVIDNKILRVNIDFNIIASKKEKIETVEEEETIFRDAKELFLEENLEEPQEEKLEEVVEKEKESTLEEKEVEAENEKIDEETQDDNEINLEEEKEDRMEIEQKKEEVAEIKETEETIINSLKGVDDSYATYHIHMVSDGESVETICTMYNSNMGILADYNDLSALAAGDKLIIPDKNE